MMDVDDLLPVNGLEGHQNGTHEQLSAAGGEGVVLEKVNGNLDLSTESAAVNGNAENEDDNEIINAGKVGEESDIRARVSARVNGLIISEVGLIPAYLSDFFIKINHNIIWSPTLCAFYT